MREEEEKFKEGLKREQSLVKAMGKRYRFPQLHDVSLFFTENNAEAPRIE